MCVNSQKDRSREHFVTTTTLLHLLWHIIVFDDGWWSDNRYSTSARFHPYTGRAQLLPCDTRAHQKMRYPNVTQRIIFSVYLFTTELRHICSSRIFF